MGVRGVVGNSAPTQLYYEVPRANHTPASAASPAPLHHRPLAPYAHAHPQNQVQPTQPQGTCSNLPYIPLGERVDHAHNPGFTDPLV